MLRTILQVWDALFFNPLILVDKWKGLPFFFGNYFLYKRASKNSQFQISLQDLFPVLQDRFASAGGVRGHYFLQDVWAARKLYESTISHHVDVASRLDGFVAHVLCFSKITYVDIRPLDINIEGLEYRKGSILELPFEDSSVLSLSCLHVIEHIGLGRYGDPIDVDGWVKGCHELIRVLAPGGILLIGVPVGIQRLCFDAHRIFNPSTIVNAFMPLRLVEFSLIDDAGQSLQKNASFEKALACSYGCGLFLFEKDKC